MPCEYHIDPLEESILEASAASKKMLGCDGRFSMPAEQRVLLEAKEIGGQVMLMRIIKHLQLDRQAARSLYFGLISEPEPQSVAEVQKFYQDLQRPR